MITKKSKEMMIKSFEKTKYRFMEAPVARFFKNYGIYVHVPFCKKKCTFCPFYKEIFTPELKEQYLEAIINEIKNKDISGKPNWIYFGGGTPNILTISDLNKILEAMKPKIILSSIGIELLPELLTKEYLNGLKEIGITKISIGIESIQEKVLNSTNRTFIKPETIKDLIFHAKKLGLWINIDMMIGLPEQNKEIFLADIKEISSMNPSQITIYPYMVIRNVSAIPSIPNNIQYELIESAYIELKNSGYERKGIWIFAKGDDIYDSSRDELTADYAGFGPAAFSTYDNWKVVNPDLTVYLKNYKNNKNLAFVAPKSKATDNWRRFARMIYDLDCYIDNKYPLYINLFILVLKLFGYSKNNKLSNKGIYFAHDITKSVVESLPFPIQNEHIIENYEEYEKAH